MANLSDAYGTIRVHKVGKEFLRFLNRVQGEKSDAYYTLVDREDLNVEADENNNLELKFSTFGRWAYKNNIEGYLKERWLNSDVDKRAYARLLAVMVQKKGSIEIVYEDSDPALGWSEEGSFTMSIENGELAFTEETRDTSDELEDAELVKEV